MLGDGRSAVSVGPLVPIAEGDPSGKHDLVAGPTVFDVTGLDALLARLRTDGFRVVGPVVRDGAIVYGDVTGVEDLPRGWGDDQEAGTYRLRRRSDDALFGYAVGPHSWKQFLFPSVTTLWRAQRTDDGFAVEQPPLPDERIAFLGVRACELHAIAVQDRVFVHSAHPDPQYVARRSSIFIVSVQCGAPAATCFCPSTRTGPGVEPTDGADIVLTELLDEDGHRFVARADTERGTDVLAAVAATMATPDDVAAADAVVANTEAHITRELVVRDVALRDLLADTLEHPSWDDVAQRCLSCTNCTLVCPTCFCAEVDDVTTLDGEAARVRRWGSCYTSRHSFLHGGVVHDSIKSRYRQWLTHKVGTWWDQFGTSGCVGCGRCITWCPVGIDLTAQIRALAEPES